MQIRLPSGPVRASLTIKQPEKAFRIGEEVVLQIVFTNTSDHDVYFKHVPGYNNPEFSYYFSILTDLGENKESRYSANIHDPKVFYHGSVSGEFLKPGASCEMKARLNRVADLDQPGRYHIQISRNDRIAEQMVTSNKVVVEIIAK